MATTRSRRWRWGSLLFSFLCLALLIGVLIYLPTQVNTAHVTDQPAPGNISLPPTVTPAP